MGFLKSPNTEVLLIQTSPTIVTVCTMANCLPILFSRNSFPPSFKKKDASMTQFSASPPPLLRPVFLGHTHSPKSLFQRTKSRQTAKGRQQLPMCVSVKEVVVGAFCINWLSRRPMSAKAGMKQRTQGGPSNTGDKISVDFDQRINL